MVKRYARHFAEVFLSSVWLLFDSVFYLLQKKLFSLASTQASTRSRFYAQMNRLTSLKPVYHVPTFKNFEVHAQQEKGSYHGRGFSHWERTVAIKTAMKRLGNRSDKIKKPLLAG